jgi:PIN domain nuclease of toxin-antitoxin system
MTMRISRRGKFGILKPDPQAGVLLDTHALLWWQADVDRLSPKVVRAIESALRILVSPISIWELTMLIEKGRISLDRPTNVWVVDFLATERVEVAELMPPVAIGAGELSGFHGDPADRIIVATAKSLRVPLLSKDDKIHTYAKSDKGLTVTW